MTNKKNSSGKLPQTRIKSSSYQTHLIMPDSHARPQDLSEPYGLSRADLFHKLVENVKPTKIVMIGDCGEFDSISSFDADKPAILANKNLKADVDVALEFLERAFGAKSKQTAFTQFHAGNHEQRMSRVVSQHPELRGFLNIERTLELERFFHSFVDYDGAVPGVSLLDGVLYSHYHTGGNFSKPISGIHAAHTMLQKANGCSMVCGHSHLLDIKLSTQRGSGTKKFGLVAGCFIEKSAKFDYVGPGKADWWSGATIIRGVENGSFSEIRFVSLDELRRIYG